MNPCLRFPVVLCALLVWPALAGAITVRNPGFEEGEKAPSNWTLSGEGAWSDGGPAQGRRCVTVRGNGKSVSTWRSDAVPLEAEGTYVLSVRARRVEGSGGVATIGPPFANLDLHDLTDQWKRYEVIFRTPVNLKREESYLRLGQWHMNGTVAFDEVEVREAEAIHRTVAESDTTPIPLGAGELLRCARGLRRSSCVWLDDASEYEFRASLEGGNSARTLFDHTAGFNTNRWVFSAGQQVTYRHRFEHSQKNVAISVTLSYHTAGSLIVEASGNQREWVKLGVLEGVTSATFGLPENFKYIRDFGIWIRLRAEGDKNGRAGLQVSDYRYFAKIVPRGRVEGLPRERRVHFGTTHWLKVISAPPRVDFRVESIGGDAITEFHRQDGLVVFASGDPPREATITLDVPGRASQRVTRPVVVSQETIWSYPAPPAGKSTLRIEMATRSGPYLAEIDLQGSESEDGTWGRRLDSSDNAAELWWCSSGHKVSPTRGLPVNEEKVASIELNLAANETEAVQLVVRPKRILGQFIALPTDLEGADGHKIAANEVQALRVEYVAITTPTDRSGAPGEWPDPLPRMTGDQIEEGSNHVLWIRVHAPKGTPSGVYSGSVRLRANHSNYAVNVPLRVRVYGFELPDRLTCSTAFGFSPSNVFKYQRLEKIEDRRAVLEKYWANFAAHHISPYDPAPLDPFKIAWPKKDAADLSPTIDWTRWDAAMERALNHYHFNSFMLRVQGLGGGTFHERVDPSLLGFPADSPQYRALMKNYLGQLQSHLKDKGWLDRAFVYWFDEPDPKDYDFVNRGFARLREDAPGLRRMLTEQVEEKLIGGPNIWCPVTPEFNATKAGPRMAAGEEFWWYVCTGPKAPYATLFIDHPATEMRVWLWQTWQRGIKGILVWETNYWTSPTAYPDSLQDPWEDPMSWQTGYGVPKGAKRGWGNGDGRFIYPPLATRDRSGKAPILEGPVDSIRWEMLRDGLEDYEYLAILQRLLKTRPDPEAAKLLEVPESITKDMTTFTKDPTAIEARRDQIARTIERLSKP